MKIVIIAGGQGTRIASVNSEIPKAMIPVCGKPIIEHEVELCKRYGFTDFLFIIGHMGDQISSFFGDGSKWSVNIEYYQENARIISSALDELGIYYTGGKNSPYVWLKCPNNMGSWEFFDLLLKEANVVGTPGEGFGENGAGYFRLTSFGDRENTIEAVERLKKLIKSL